jgi:hypothetical protein
MGVGDTKHSDEKVKGEAYEANEKGLGERLRGL